MIWFSMISDPCTTTNIKYALYIRFYILKWYSRFIWHQLFYNNKRVLSSHLEFPYYQNIVGKNVVKRSPYRSICLLNTNYRPQHRVMHIPVMRSDDYSHSFSWSQKTISYQVFNKKKTYELNRWCSIANKKIIKMRIRYYTTIWPYNM